MPQNSVPTNKEQPHGRLSKLWSLLGPQYNTAPIIYGTQKGTLILRTTHIVTQTSEGALIHQQTQIMSLDLHNSTSP